MVNKKVKFVIIGSGNIANTYGDALQHVENGELVGVVSSSMKKISKYNEIPSFPSISAIDIEFDAIIICTPNGLHHKSAIEAASLKKHVLCEKPIDITLEAIDLMISACETNNVKLGVAYQRRYSSDNPTIKEMINDGQFGKIFSVDLAVKNYRNDAYYNSAPYRGGYEIDGGGPFIQQACHYIDLYYWYFGKPKKLVSALGTFVHDIEVEDHGAVICIHENGMIGTITASTATKPGFPAKLELYCEKGYVILVNDVITHWEIEGIVNPTKTNAKDNTHTGSDTALVEDTTNHETIVKDFVNSIVSGKDPMITGKSARNATEIILDIYNGQF